MSLGDEIGRNQGVNGWVQKRQNDYCKGVEEFIEQLLTNSNYAACTIDTDDNCIVCDIGLTEDNYISSKDDLVREFKQYKQLN